MASFLKLLELLTHDEKQENFWLKNLGAPNKIFRGERGEKSICVTVYMCMHTCVYMYLYIYTCKCVYLYIYMFGVVKILKECSCF